jgi:hypothetical protein
MPSSKPLIALRLPQPMHDLVRDLAAKDGRTVSNFIEQQLRRLVGADLEPVFVPPRKRRVRKGRQLDITDAIAAAVKRGPSKHK